MHEAPREVYRELTVVAYNITEGPTHRHLAVRGKIGSLEGLVDLQVRLSLADAVPQIKEGDVLGLLCYPYSKRTEIVRSVSMGDTLIYDRPRGVSQEQMQ